MRSNLTDVLLSVADFVRSSVLVLLVSGVALTILPTADPVHAAAQPVITAAQDDAQWVTADPSETILLPEGHALEHTPMVPVIGTRYVVPEESPDGGHVLPTVLWLDNSPVYSGPQTWVLHVDDTQHRVTWRLYVDVVSGARAAPVESAQVVNVAYATSTDQPSAQERKAARLILARIKSGKRIYEDLTWRGAPRVVGQHNDALLDRFEQTGQRYTKANIRAFLGKVATDKAVAGSAGKVRAEDGTYVPRSFYDRVRGPSKATCDYLGKRLVPDPRFGTRCA